MIALAETGVIVGSLTSFHFGMWFRERKVRLPSSQKPQMMNLLTGGQKLCADCHVLIWHWEF